MSIYFCWILMVIKPSSSVVLDRSPVDTSSNRNTIERTNIARSSRQEGIGQNVGTNRIQDMGRNRGPDAGLPSDPLDLFNTPRSMNLINSNGNSNGQSRENRKVSITICAGPRGPYLLSLISCGVTCWTSIICSTTTGIYCNFT
jgi:hypothetical protein